MNRMDDLIAFLRARLDEDAELALAAGAELGPDWRYDAEHGWVRAVREGDGIATGHQDHLEPEHGQHIARHDPARVLAEVEAKRRIIDECAYWIDKINSSATDKYPYPNLPERGEVVLPVLTLLALPYADHPDYRDTWRP